MENNIADDIENGSIGTNSTKWAKIFQEKYAWDLLAAKGIWTFGPDNNSANILVDDTLPGEVRILSNNCNIKLSKKGGQKIVVGFKRCNMPGFSMEYKRRTTLR